jgi:UDP-N-acetylglucosamine--N-acetylmuramyl-(pentapeptide) pyrophosphoryl-undecaprenol N-acetylglucosamine transferase
MRFVIAGGGTGGHLFPGMAIAEAFVEREMGNEVLFIGTERGIEARVLAGGKFPLRTIPAKPLKGRSLLGKAKAIWSIPMAITEAYSILKDFQPQLVLGVGGYASGPALMAASLLGMRRAIHEQNVIPGMTNRILKWFSQRIFVSFEETKRYFPGEKTIVTGNPIRREISEGMKKSKGDRFPPHPESPALKPPPLGWGAGFTLLIFGGSAGAHRINEAVMEALGQLQEIKPFLRFFHQTGKEDVDWVSKSYQEKGFDARVRPFFEDMATYYQLSDLVVCRSGASTVAELAICGRAAILIPYPYAAHNHQLINAQKLVELGAARIIRDEELSGPSLGQTILHLYNHPEERTRMEEQIRLVGRPRAAQEIVDHCYALIHGG